MPSGDCPYRLCCGAFLIFLAISTEFFIVIAGITFIFAVSKG
jgi:hypothetical protein